MTLSLLAQLPGGLSFIQLVIAIIIVVGVVAILFLVFRQLGIAIPGWVIQIFWIVVLVVVAILAVKFIASMW